MPERLQQYRFNYKKGPAPLSGVVEAHSEAEGYEVACAWCRANDVRPPAKVFPVILAGPEILGNAVVVDAPQLPDPSQAKPLPKPPTMAERVVNALR